MNMSAQIYKVFTGEYAGKTGFISFEYAANRVGFRFGTPTHWQGEVILDRSALRPSEQ